MIVLPWQLSRRAELYHQLGSLTTSGIGLLPALEIQQRNPPSRAFRAPLGRLIHHLGQGDTFASALKRLGTWLPEFDVALLEAGEKSGRLPATFYQLSLYYQQQSEMMRTLLGRVAYPFLLLHFAFLIFPLSSLIAFVQDFNVIRFLGGKLLLFAPLYGGVLFLVYATQGQRGEFWRGLVESVLNPVPLLGRARRWLAIARLSSALEALLNAGTPIVQSWELASAASGSPRLHRVVQRFLPSVEAGTTPAEAVSASGAFPPLFANQYHSGEISGRTDETLRHMSAYFHDEGQRLFKSFILVLGGVVYGAVVILVAFQIISFYVGYYGNMLDAIH